MSTTIPGLPPGSATVHVPSRPSQAPDRYPAAADGQFVIRWDPSMLAKDNALRVTVSGRDHEMMYAVGGKEQGSTFGIGLGYAKDYRLNDFDKVVKAASDAMMRLAETGGGDYESGKTYTPPTTVITGVDITDNGLVHDRRDIGNGEFELSVIQPGAEQDVFLTGSLDQLDRYPEGIADAVRAALRLAAELKP